MALAKTKKPAIKKPNDTWVEMKGFKSEKERLKCLELFKAGYQHSFRKSLLKTADGKIWFRVRAKTFTGRARTAREIRECIADVNRRGLDNLCTSLLRMLRSDH